MRVGTSDGRGGGDRRVAQQRVLDDRRVDVVAAADDQVLGPAGEVDEAVGVDPGQVAGVQPAVDAACRGRQRRRRARAAGDVAGEHGGPADGQHARPRPGGRSTQVPSAPMRTAFTCWYGSRWPTDPGRAAPGGAQRAGAGGLGQAVALEQRHAGVRARSRPAPRCGSGEAPTTGKRRLLMSASTGHLGQGGVDGGHGAHRGDPVVLDELPEVRVQGRVAVAQRPGPHDLLAREQRGEQGDDEGVDVEQRQRREAPLTRA